MSVTIKSEHEIELMREAGYPQYPKKDGSHP